MSVSREFLRRSQFHIQRLITRPSTKRPIEQPPLTRGWDLAVKKPDSPVFASMLYAREFSGVCGLSTASMRSHFLFFTEYMEPSLNGPPNGGPFPFPRRKFRSAKGVCDTHPLLRLARQSATPTLSASRKPAVRTVEDGGNAPELSLPLSCAHDPS
jgi:hypothetical protein